MDMTRDCIDKIQETAVPNEIDYQGRKFVDKKMIALPREITAEALRTATLTSIVDYIKQDTDKFALTSKIGCTEQDVSSIDRFVIHVAGHNAVELYKELNADKKRDHLISASFEGSDFPYERFMPIENFIIDLQSMFKQDDNTKALLKFVGSVKNDQSAEQQDDGVSQKITMRQGISLSTVAKVPNPVYLRPFRTFAEIDQPQSAFVFRVRKDEREGVTAALFEADGAAWKNQAIQSIKDYLTKELKGQSAIILA